jgi:hypothetical protein
MTNRGTTSRKWEVGVFGVVQEDVSPAKLLMLRFRISVAQEI